MAEIVNLNKARKAAGRAARKRKGKEQRATRSVSRPDPGVRRRERQLDGKRLDAPPEGI